MIYVSKARNKQNVRCLPRSHLSRSGEIESRKREMCVCVPANHLKIQLNKLSNHTLNQFGVCLAPPCCVLCSVFGTPITQATPGWP